MDRGALSRPAGALRGCKMALFAAAVLLCELRMFIGTYRNILEDNGRFFHIEIRAGELVVLGFVVFLALAAVFRPHALRQLRNVLRRFRTYDYFFLFFLAFWYLFCCLLRQSVMGNNSFRNNEWWVYITFVTSFVFFPFAGALGTERAGKVIGPMLKVVLLPNMVFTGWILWQWFHCRPVVFPSGSALSALSSFSLAIGENRLHTANRALALLFLCLYFVVSEKGWRKALYALGGLEYLAVVILTNNRGSWYPAMAALALLGFVVAWHRTAGKKMLLRGLLCLLCAAGCVLCLSALRGEVFRFARLALQSNQKAEALVQAENLDAENLSPQLVTLSGSVTRPLQAAATSSASDAAEEPAAVIHTLSDGMSGREPIYRGSVYLMLQDWQHFLFGITHYEVGEALRVVNGETKVQPSTHNFFLQMGVAFGVPVMLLSIAFALLLTIRSIRILFRADELFPGARMVPMVVLPLLLADMFDTTLTAGNTLPCAVFYLIAGWTVAIDRSAPVEERRRDALWVGLFTGALLVFSVMAWWLYPWFRTLYYSTPEADGSRLLLPGLTMAALLLLLVSLGRLVVAMWRREKLSLRKGMPVVAALLLFLCCLGNTNRRINRLTEALAPSLEQERPVIEAVRGAEGCCLLVDHLPEVYARTFGGVRHTLFKAEDLASRQDVVLITDADTEYSTLLARGYLYAEISDRQAVYTRSPDAIQALEEAGYHLTGYYSRNWSVNMRQVNEGSSKGTLTLAAAKYQAEFDLQMQPYDYAGLAEEDVPVMTLMVSLPGEEQPLALREVKSSEFGEDGSCKAYLEFTLPKTGAVDFYAEALELPDSCTLLVQSVRCSRHPDYDVHAEYNLDGWRIREFYFTLDGDIYTLPDGSQGKEYDYDNAGNNTAIRYLDCDGNLVPNSVGYAEVRRAFNGARKVVREEYFDDNGQPVNIGNGFACFQNTYDDKNNLLLTEFYDAEGEYVACGSSNFHNYLKLLADKKNNGAFVFVSIKDEGTSGLTVQLLADLKELGLQGSLLDKFRYSYCAVVGPDIAQEKLSSDEPGTISGAVGGHEYVVSSAGFSAGNYSSIVIDGEEYSKNVRGMNIVVFEDGRVTDTVAFDTYSLVMAMTR